MDSEDSDSELYSKNTTLLNILHVECSDTENESDQKRTKIPFIGLNYSYNSHASTPIAENRTSRPPSWRDFAKLQLKYPKEMSVIY